jgi:glucan-binding YG repeat protein
MKRKKTLYQQYGVEEYYEYDPENNKLVGYIRQGEQKFKRIPKMNGWNSPRLGLTFRLKKDGFRLHRPDDEPIRNTQELEQARIAEQEARIVEQEARKQAEAREKAEREARKQAEAKTTELQNELNALKKKLATSA